MTERLNELTHTIIAAAIPVHRTLGPGLLESAYLACLVYELRKRGLKVRDQVPVPVKYDGIELDCAYRLDLLVEDEVIVEVKAVERFTAVHEAQVLSYLRLMDKRVGLLLNFHAKWLTDQGVKRLVNGFLEKEK